MLTFNEFRSRFEHARGEACDACQDCECDACKYNNIQDAWDSYCDECYHQERDNKMWREREGK